MRIEHPEKPASIVISRSDFETDLAKGFCILEYSPEVTRALRNPKDPKQEVQVKIPQVKIFRCMRCKFDAVDTDYADKTVNGMGHITKHLANNNHPWPYTIFENPYGNVVDVTIEGVDNYPKFLKERYK